MFESVLIQIRALVRARRYFVTPHADDAMLDDELVLDDVVECVLTGHVVERQRDQEHRTWKYLVEGGSATGSRLVVVAAFGVTGKLIVVTVYSLEHRDRGVP